MIFVLSMLTIREATINDADTIVSLIKELAEYEKLSHEVVATKELIEKNLFGEHSTAESLIASYEGSIVGFALFFTNFSTFLAKPGIYLEDLYVKPQFRGKGIGKKLLLELVQIAKQREYGRVEWAVLDWNNPAIQFYRSLGAQPQDEWTVYRITSELFDGMLS